MEKIIVEVQVLELAGALRVKGQKVLAWQKAKIWKEEAEKLAKEGLVKIIWKAETITPPTTEEDGQVLDQKTKPSVPVVEGENDNKSDIVKKEEIEEEVEKLIKEYTFKDLASHAKTLGLTKVVWISAKDLARNIVLKEIERQGKKIEE